jgi:tRNA dimethylallyltransferase
MKKPRPKIIVILGPTATGKSDLAVTLALKHNGEVISADSRQVYKGLDIGSGKITPKEMKGVPHHLLDICSPKKIYNVEEFKKDGQEAIQDIISRGRLPIICGGTGFYINALVFDEEFPNVAPNPKLRASLSKKSASVLMRELARLDSRRAKDIDPYNKVKIIRAIEIAKSLGVVPKVKRRNLYQPLFIGLEADRELLRERIRARLLKRINAGMTDEVESLRARGLSWKRLHSLGLEYRYIALFLQKKISETEMVEKLEREIVDYSKRQITWFKRNKDIHWLGFKKTAKIKKLAADFLA